MTTIYFTNHQDWLACWIFKEVFMHHLRKKLPSIWISNVYNQLEPKVSVSWHWSSVRKASILLQKDVLKNFTKSTFSLRDIIKIVSDQESIIPTQPVIFM